MGLNGSVLIANPIPAEKEFTFEKMEELIQEALQSANEKKIIGKEITPFILKFIADKTSGESLESNISLVYNNAKLGALIACEM